jgi:hypothetical protein
LTLAHRALQLQRDAPHAIVERVCPREHGHRQPGDENEA